MFSDVPPPEGCNKGNYSSDRAVSMDKYAAGISAGKNDSGRAALLIKDPSGDNSGIIAGSSSAAPIQTAGQ